MDRISIIQIANYSGPLDVLLSLIQAKKIDIFEINLVEVANEYVRIIGFLLDDCEIDLISEYLVMAATLINLKARILSKKPQEKKIIEREKKSLLVRLAIYQQFHNIANKLREYEWNKMRLHSKKRSNITPFILPIDQTKLDDRGNIVQLIIVIKKMFKRVYANKLKQTTVQNINLSPIKRRQELLKILQKNPFLAWEKVCAVASISHFALTWITLLDMACKQEVILHQSTLFGPIEIKKGIINE